MMNITVLKNRLQHKESVEAGLETTKKRLASINFYVSIVEKGVDRGFITETFSNTTIGAGSQVVPSQILSEVNGMEDIAFLIFNNEGMVPTPLNPTQSPLKKGNATACQMCEQWYNNFPDVFSDFFLHEICHAMYFLLGKVAEDKTHFQGSDPAWQNKQNYEWYLHLIQELMPAWNAYKNTPVIARTLRIGMEGEDVKQLQLDMNLIMKTSLVADGKFGKRTQKVVEDFQTANGLKDDGVVGKFTREMIAKKKVS